MSLDQVFFMLTQSSKPTRKRDISIESAAALAGPDGRVKGRAEDGTKFKATWHGKSLAQRIRDGEVGANPGPAAAGPCAIDTAPTPQKKRRGKK